MVLSRSGYWLRPQNRSPDRRQAGVIASALRFYLYTRVILGGQPRHAPRRLRNHRADRRRRDEYIGLPEAWDRSGTRISKEQPGRRNDEDLRSAGCRRTVGNGSHRTDSRRSAGAHRAREVTGTEYAVRAAAGRAAGALRLWLRQDHVLRG